jgi:hypothetical protein
MLITWTTQRTTPRVLLTYTSRTRRRPFCSLTMKTRLTSRRTSCRTQPGILLDLLRCAAPTTMKKRTPPTPISPHHTPSPTYSPHNKRHKCRCSRCSHYLDIFNEMNRKMLLKWAEEVHEKFVKRYLRHLGGQRVKRAIKRLDK